MTAAPAPLFNPFEPGFTDDPYEQYARLRALAPVQETPLGFFLLFRADDVSALLRDPRHSVEDAKTPDNPRVALRRQVLGDRATRGERGMLNVDPPDHTRLRALVQQAFTPRRVDALGAHVHELVDAALDAADARGGETDLIRDLAFPLPFAVITEMLGMPPGDRDELRGWSHMLTRGLEPLVSPDDIRAVVEASDHVHAYMLEVIAWKRDHLADDLLSALLGAEGAEDRLTPEELVDQATLLYLAGHETTVNLIGNGMAALLRHPDELTRWAHDPGLAARAVEELLRYDCPVQFSRRITKAPLITAEREIPPDSLVLACLGSANRDVEVWGEHADVLDLRRDASRHVSFGHGVHHCLGNSLARLEARVALGTLVRRYPDVELAADAPTWNGRLVLRGLDELPLRLGRRAD